MEIIEQYEQLKICEFRKYRKSSIKPPLFKAPSLLNPSYQAKIWNKSPISIKPPYSAHDVTQRKP